MVAVVIDDSLFAALIGASFVASLSLFAWIVKNLVSVTVELKNLKDDFAHLDGRLTNLEHFNGRTSPRP